MRISIPSRPHPLFIQKVPSDYEHFKIKHFGYGGTWLEETDTAGKQFNHWNVNIPKIKDASSYTFLATTDTLSEELASEILTGLGIILIGEEFDKKSFVMLLANHLQLNPDKTYAILQINH